MTACRVDVADGERPATVYLREYEKCECDLLTLEHANLLREQFGNYITVSRSWTPNTLQLEAKQFVGTIVLGDLRIVVEPKVGLDNLFYMLTYAYDLAEFRNEITTLDIGDDIFECIVVIFLRQVERLVRRGIYRTYIEQQDNHPFLRGRLLIADHLQQNAVHPQRFYQRTNEFTADVLENRILKNTMALLSRLDYTRPNLRQQVRRTTSAFSEVSLVPVVPSDCDHIIFTRLNAAYRTPVNLARLLLQHLSLEGYAGETPFASYLFDMNKVFELFVARYLQSHFARHPAISVDIQQDIWLDDDQKESAVPDLVLRNNGRRYLVLDTKYKHFNAQPLPGDRYQMLVYCQTLQLDHGILIYAEDGPVHYRRRFQAATLSALSLPLSGTLTEFRERCLRFAEGFEGELASTGIVRT